MDSNKKRKRESDKPRITYHASNRTFDRLFKEESLNETKEVVRRKLGIASDAVIHLTQLREGKAIDLEDDDDFDAFCALAHSMSSVDVRVTVGANSKSNKPLMSTPMTPNKMKMKKNRASSVVLTPDRNNRHSSLDGSQIPIENRKRKVSFVDPFSTDATATSLAITKPKQKKRRDNSGNVVDLSEPQTSKTPVTTSISESLLADDPLRLKKPNQDRREFPEPCQTPVDTLPGSSLEHVSEFIVDGREKELVPNAPPNPVTVPTKHKKSRRLREPTMEAVNESSALSNRSIDQQEKPKKKKSRRGDAQEDSSSTSVLLAPDGSSSHPTSTLVPGEIDKKLKKASKASVKDQGRHTSRPTTSGEIPDSPLNLLSAEGPDNNVAEPNATQRAPKKPQELSRESLPFAEQLAGAISKTGEITRKHLAESIAIEEQKDHKRKAKKPQGLEQQTQSTGHHTSPVASPGAPSSLSDKPKKRRKSESNVDPTTVGRIDIGKSKNSGKKKGKGSDGVAVNLGLSNDASTKTEQTKGKRKLSTKDEVEAAAADVKGAMSRVLAAMRASAEPFPSKLLAQAGITSSDSTEVETENRHKKAKRPSGKSMLRMSRGPDDFREDECSSVKDVGEAKSRSSPSQTEDATLTQETQTSKGSTIGQSNWSASTSCPVCQCMPPHVQCRCPVIVAGPEPIERRLFELRQKTARHRSHTIVELEGILEAGRQTNATKDRKSNVNAHSTLLTLLSSTTPQVQGHTLSNLSDDIPGAPTVPVAPTDSSLIPTNSPNFGVRQNEKNFSGSSSEDDGEDDDCDNRTSDDSNEISHIVGDVTVYAGIDLDALARGPQASRLSVTDILSSQVSDSDDSDGDVVLEVEEEDNNFGPRATKLHSAGSSDDDDLDSQMAIDEDDDVSPSVVTGPPSIVDNHCSSLQELVDKTVSFRAADGSGESVEVDKTGDTAFSHALAADTAILQLENTEGEEKEEMLADVDEPCIPLSQPLVSNIQEKETLLVAEDDNLVHQDPKCPLKLFAGNSKNEKLTAEPTPANEELTPTRRMAFRPLGHSGTVLKNPISTDCDEQDDPIEPAEEFEVREPTSVKTDYPNSVRGGNVLNSQSTPKGGMVRRMKNRSGKVPLNDRDIPAPDSHIARVPKRSKDISSSQEDSEKHDLAKRTRIATRSLSRDVMPPPLHPDVTLPVTRQPAKSAAENALETDAKVAAKEQKAQTCQERALAKAAAKTTVRGSNLKGCTSDTSTASFSVTSPLPQPSSLDRWATLQPSPPHLDPDSSVMVDELRSSSPEGPALDLPSKKRKARSTGSDTAPVAPPDHNNNSDTDAALQGNPLFILTESQPPFPYSQWNSLGHLEENQPQGASRVPSPTESALADEEEVEASVRSLPRSQKSRGPYRKLTDITSQQTLFSTPAPLRPATFPRQRNKLDDLYGRSGREEESDPESDSDSDEDAQEKSHIPKSRRAGITQRKS